MKKLFKKKDTSKNGGYTLLFAVLVSSLVLSIGISILNISKKEFLLSTSARDSSLAFYAADGGFECALLADNNDVFKTDDANIGNLTQYCKISSSIFASPGEVDPYLAVFNFHAKFDSEGSSCAIVNVIITRAGGPPITTTEIESRGYNTGWNSNTNKCDTASPKRVERAIKYTYKY